MVVKRLQYGFTLVELLIAGVLDFELDCLVFVVFTVTGGFGMK